eukprot:CAMPEP_0183528858 /NCGR_PEP_ID=MMETSP0371-20130417/22996_1 /TAXON_ID=268820 /ORGANISM="Peridinium aciculiferum, Strain PAER-2" /LENGTH=358 /DNA_ID=CAMNT_0025728525 /DNA_START=16 /DNA_END=1092 /DNA_ORIENTATION=-
MKRHKHASKSRHPSLAEVGSQLQKLGLLDCSMEAVRRSPTARVSTAVLSAIVAEGGQGRPDRSASLKGALGATETKSGCLGWTLGDTSSGTGRPTEPQHRQSDNEPVTELRRGLDDKEWFVGCTQTTAEFEQCCTAQDVGGKVAFATPELCGRHYCLHQSRIFSSVHPQHQPHRPTPHSCPIAMVRATAKCQDASLGAKLQSGLPQLVPPFLPLAVPESSCPQAQGPARPSSTRGGNLPNEVLHQTLNVCPLTGAVSKTAGKLGGTLQATSSRQWCINQKFLRWPEEPATSPSTHQRGRSRSPSGCSSAAAAEGAAEQMPEGQAKMSQLEAAASELPWEGALAQRPPRPPPADCSNSA